MAMRPRTGGIPPLRPRPPMRPVYEDFQPMSSWKHEQESHVLTVNLPGFQREQVKVSVETSSMIKVHGQRPLGNNKWSRFNLDFQIPETCNVTAITAKFENGILSVTMPKKIAPPQVSTPQQQQQQEVAPKTTQEAETPKAPSSTTTASIEKQRDEKIAQSSTFQKPQKGQEEIPPKATSTTVEKQKDEKIAQSSSFQKPTVEPKSQKGKEEIPPKDTSIAGVEKQRDERSAQFLSPQKAAIEPKSQKGQEEVPPKAPTSMVGGEKQTHMEGVKAAISPQKYSQKGEGKLTSVEASTSTAAAATTEKQRDGKIETKEKSREKEKESGEKHKESMGAKEVVTAAASEFNLEKYMKVVKGLPMKMREERQTLMNMGAAIGVIVALGAYISYFGPSGKAKN